MSWPYNAVCCDVALGSKTTATHWIGLSDHGPHAQAPAERVVRAQAKNNPLQPNPSLPPSRSSFVSLPPQQEWDLIHRQRYGSAYTQWQWQWDCTAPLREGAGVQVIILRGGGGGGSRPVRFGWLGQRGRGGGGTGQCPVVTTWSIDGPFWSSHGHVGAACSMRTLPVHSSCDGPGARIGESVVSLTDGPSPFGGGGGCLPRSGGGPSPGDMQCAVQEGNQCSGVKGSERRSHPGKTAVFNSGQTAIGRAEGSVDGASRGGAKLSTGGGTRRLVWAWAQGLSRCYTLLSNPDLDRKRLHSVRNSVRQSADCSGDGWSVMID